ncbi:hypothetical protein SASPL_153772 [Salvia splendens]|uniref:pectinesterase n=1 Tax=Salvia splendens TaxID=180675 RepID=A0A8X8VYX5_SALSN|nr:hypothetical protein SASPL_153772 [Salvia splendens]
MSGRNHSIAMEANHISHPCKNIKVHKNPKKGDFNTIKSAIASLPLFNPCRAVISVAPGTYREKIEIPVTFAVTFAVNAPHFVAKNIIFKVVHNLRVKVRPPSAGAAGKQAVALRISADMAAFINCRFVGAAEEGKHARRNWLLLRQLQGHRVGRPYLGRAWGTFSRVVFAYTYMDKMITPRGNETDFNVNDFFWCRTVFYGQFKCSGPGASFGGRVTWARELTKEEAQPFISLSFIDGHEWLTSLL